VSLDEYRERLLGRLKTCTDTAAVRSMLAEADLRLMNARLTTLARSRFWESLQEDLTAIAEAAGRSADREAGMNLAGVIAAAQARIARYRERLSERQQLRRQ
jgi:hypothetical protein